MIKICKNIITPSFQNAISNIAFNETFDWWYHDRTLPTRNGNKFEGDTFQFTNQVIDIDTKINSKYSDFITPLILSTQDSFNIKIKDIIRVKFNMTLKTPMKSITHPPHVDTFDKDYVSVVYYVHDCDGDTVIYDKLLDSSNENDLYNFNLGLLPTYDYKVVKTVTPKKGSAVMFDSRRMHSSSTPFINDRRIVLNCMFKV